MVHCVPYRVALRSGNHCPKRPAGFRIGGNPGLQRDYITHLVRNGQGSMPNFRRTEITNDELDALLAYFDTLKEAKQ